MSLYAGDVDIALPIELETAAAVVQLVIRYDPTENGQLVEWDLAATGSSGGVVRFTRVLEAGDLPVAKRGGYLMRAKAYGAGAVLLFETDEFNGPNVEPSRI